MQTGNIWFLLKIGATQGRRQHQVTAVQDTPSNGVSDHARACTRSDREDI
jgi:hypothetical protein